MVKKSVRGTRRRSRCRGCSGFARRQHPGRARQAVRVASQPDRGMEAATAGAGAQGFRWRRYGGCEPVNLDPLYAKIGQLTLENDFSERALTKAGWLSAK